MDSPERLFEAIARGDMSVFSEVLSKDPGSALARNEQGVSALMHAAYHRRQPMLEALLQKGIPLDIWEASATGRTDRVRELLGRIPSLLDAVSADGYTPLALAAFFSHEQTARFLVEEGADVNSRSRNAMGVTALHSAVASRTRPIVELLIESGADVNALQQGGFTPLHGVAFAGDLEITELLVRAGADPLLKTDGGKTARALALENGHTAVTEYLRQVEGS